MRELLSLLFRFFKASLSGRCNLALENLALRQQLAILKRTQKRLVISTKDRLLWVWLSRIWSEWRACPYRKIRLSFFSNTYRHLVLRVNMPLLTFPLRIDRILIQQILIG